MGLIARSHPCTFSAGEDCIGASSRSYKSIKSDTRFYSCPLPNEPLEIYAAAIREMVNTAFSGTYDYGPQFREHEYLRRFVQGLDQDTQTKCREHGPQNLNYALTIAHI